MKKSFFAVIAISLMLVFSGGQALASMADAKATLDVSNLVGIASTTFTFAPYVAANNGTSAYAKNTLTVDGANYNALSSTATVAGSATATGAINSAKTTYSTISHSDNSGNPNTMSQALAGYSGTFSYDGTTPLLVHVAIPYTVEFVLQASSGTAAVAYGNATISFLFTTTSANRPGPSKTVTQKQEVAIETQVDNMGNLTNNFNSGIFEFDILLFAGDVGSFSFNTLAETSASSVPLPAAFWFFGPGLAGLVGIRRRFFQ